MKKKSILLLALLLQVVSLMAAETINGIVLDSKTQKPIDFANVTIYSATGTTPITGTMTNENGRFELSAIEQGRYRIVVTYVGYIQKEVDFSVTSERKNVGRILLDEDTQLLSEVEVVAQGSSMRFELDKKVFSVDQNIAASGGSASDVLGNIPSVQVDQEGNISLRNSESVEVWINGKPSGLTTDNRAQVLQQLPAESIQEIELITNPSAKYSPEGTSGIINIVLKKNRAAGYYGSVTAGVMYPTGGTPGYNVGLNLNYSRGIVDAFVNVGYRQMSMLGSNLSDRYSYMGADTTRLYQTGRNETSFGGLFTRAGIDVRLSDKSTIGFIGFGIIGDSNSQLKTIDYRQTDVVNNLLLRNYNRIENATGNRPMYNFTLDYKIEFTKSQELRASANYGSFQRYNSSVYTQNNLFTGTSVMESQQEQVAESQNNRWEFKADYTNNFTKDSRLELGTQITLQENNSLSEATDLMTNQPLNAFYNDFNYKEKNYALYVTYGNRFWDKLSAQVGLRGEYLLRDVTTIDASGNVTPSQLKSFELFPSAYLSYSLPNENELQLNYTRRIDRARGRMINPFKDFSDSTSILFGNPLLKPQYSSALELNYLKNWDRHTLSGGVFYRYTDNLVQSVRYLNGNVMERTWINVSRSQDVGVELVAKNNFFGNFLQLTTSVNGYYSKMDAAAYTFESTNTTVHLPSQRTLAWTARMNAQMMFTKTFSGQITGGYASPQLEAQGRSTHSYSVDLGLRKSFFNRTLNLNLSVRDLFNSRNRQSENWGDNFYQYSKNQWQGRTIGLTATYNFGNMKPKNRNNQSQDNGVGSYSDDMGE